MSELSDSESLDWRELDSDEQRVMSGAIDASELEGVWSAFLPTEDLQNFDRAYLYVPSLALAARRLIELDLVGVSARVSPREFIDLTSVEACVVVSNLSSWGVSNRSHDENADEIGQPLSPDPRVRYSFHLMNRDQQIEYFTYPAPMTYVASR
jgi:hypothetical protein